MEDINNPKVLRKTLIYLYENGCNNNDKILLEMLQKSKKASVEEVEQWFIDTNTNPDDYYTILDENYPRELYKWDDAPYVIKKVVYDNTIIN